MRGTSEGTGRREGEAVEEKGDENVSDEVVCEGFGDHREVLIGAITIPEDLNGDGILNADELGTDGSFNAQVALGPDALDGTVVNVNGRNDERRAGNVCRSHCSPAHQVKSEGSGAIHAEPGDAPRNVDFADADVTVTV
ncbi:hypothetical protein, partial [Acinetobacter baumannii]|uniref:hypothetical protein n=1 Tax=Acinetobacter baumannii TaxID=470 RepID=UPI00398C3C76